MIKTPEDLFASVVLFVLFCPALYGLGSALLKATRGAVSFQNENLRSGVVLHALNALISPCIPAYLLYVDIKTGGGSMASILSLPIIPVTWILFFIGQKKLAQAKRSSSPPPPNSGVPEKVCHPQGSPEQPRKEGSRET